MELSSGDIVVARIVRLVAFGAFAQLEDGRQGLIHISQLGSGFIQQVSDHVQVGQEVRVKILPPGPDGKLALSMKQAAAAPSPERRQPERPHPEPAAPPPDSFEAKMARFIKDSNETQSALNRQRDNHRRR